MKLNSINCVIAGVSGPTGDAIRTYLLEQGATVIGTTRFENGSDGLIKLDQCSYQIGMDPLNTDSVKTTVQTIIDEIGTIQAWVNVIGGFTMGDLIEDTSRESWDSMWQINFATVLNTTTVILPHFKQAQVGRLINFGSAAVAEGMAQAGPYLVSKAAVHALTKTTAAEQSTDITCNAILPRIIDTPANRQAMPEADFSTWVSPKTIAQKVATILSTQINGELIIL